MKLNNTIKGTVILLGMIVLIGALRVTTVSAGKSEVVVDNASYKEKLDTMKWNNPNQDITISNGKLIIPSDSTEDTRIITMQPVVLNQQLEELFRSTATIKLTDLPEGEKFIFAFGLASIEEYPGNPGNIEIAFTNNGGLKVGVTAYDDNGDAVTIAKAISCGSLNSNLTLNAILTADNKLTLKVGGKTICNKKEIPIECDGNLGFLQTGNCGAEISDVNISIYTYDTPQNPDIFEDFETGAMNTSVFSSKTVYRSSYFPQSLAVQEMDGNHVLRFNSCGLAYIGTVYQYSNFELTFDVPFLQRSDQKDKNDKVIVPRNSNFLIAFGGDVVDFTDAYGYTQAAEVIMFPTTNEVMNYSETQIRALKTHPIYDQNIPNDRGFSVKLSVIDAKVTVGLKWESEKKFTTVLEYELPNGTPTGHIHIWSPDTVSNFAIDNIKLVNKDKNPETITVEYTCDKFEKPDDFPYQEGELVYRPDVEDATDNQTEFGVYVYILYAIVAGGIIMASGFLVNLFLRKKRKKEEGVISNEV